MAESGLKRSLTAGMRRAGRAEKFVILLLTFILITAATASVSAVLTGPNWASMWESLLFGLLIGWLLAIFGWPAWRSAVLVLLTGALFSLLFAAGLNEKILAVLGEIVKLAGTILTTLKIKGLDLSPIGGAFSQLIIASGVVLSRAALWLKDLASGQANFDPVAAGIVWSFTVWILAAWAGWITEATKNALLAVLPALLLCLSTLSYARNVSTTIYFLLGLTLVLIAVVQYDHREQAWNESGVAFPGRKGREVGNISLVISIMLVVLAAALSSFSIQRIIQLSSRVERTGSRSESGLAKSLGIIPAATPTPDAFSNTRSPGLPRELLIGSGPELSGEQVMSVRVDNLGSLVQDGQLAPLYWRSFTYDIYTGHGWSSSDTHQTQYQPGQPISIGGLPGHVQAQEQISLVPGAEGTVYAAGEPVSIDVAAVAAWRSSNDLFGIQAADSNYAIQSLVPVVSENTLRQAGQDYPGWVVQRYLAVPSSVPARVKELAIQLTASEPTPYDRAHAIEQYLRKTYPYTVDVPRPPADLDLVDYFLFDLRKGYCDYYASAMVILARSAGIPARLVIGYASGNYNEKSNRFIVTQADAHSWAELYFPGIGWVPFEATAGLPAINRGVVPAQPEPPAPTPAPSPTPVTGTLHLSKYAGWIILSAIILIGFAWVGWDEVKLVTMKPRPLSREIFRRIRRYTERLGAQLEAGDTPYEILDKLIAVISEGADQSRKTDIESTTRDRAQALVSDIVRLSYQPATSDKALAAQIITQWRSLRWRLRRVWILSWWSILFRKPEEEAPEAVK